MKVLHIASDDTWGGAEAQIAQIIRGFTQQGNNAVQCCLLTFNKGRLYNIISTDHEAEIALETLGFLSVLKKAINFTKMQNPSLIMSHGYKEGIIAFLVSRRLEKGWIHQFHGTSENYSGFKLLKSKLYLTLERALAKLFADKMITVSRSMQKQLGLNNSQKTSVIYNAALPPSLPHPYEAEASGVYRLWLIGRIAPVKRVDLAIKFLDECLKKSPSVKLELHIVGDGPLLERCKEDAVKRGLNAEVFFHGFKEDPWSLVDDDKSILILTSDSEGIPTVILEAMHKKIPIITREVGGIREIKDKCPNYPLTLVNHSELPNFSNILLKSIADYDLIRKKAKDCDTSYFKIGRLIKEHLELYKFK